MSIPPDNNKHEIRPHLPEHQGNGIEGSSEQPLVIDVASLPEDQQNIEKARANLVARRIGTTALSEQIETKEKPIRNLYEAILWAREGDAEAREMIRTNVATDAMERIFKAGNIMDVDLDTDTQGRILQNGQLMDDVHRNAFQMASANSIIAERTKAEAKNGARIEQLQREGKLNDYAFVVLSRTLIGVDDETLDKMNFFSKTKPIAIQLTTNDTDTGLHTESAFFAGVSSSEAPRHDKEVVEALGKIYGKDYEDMPGADVIEQPMLIHKSLLPNGVSDIVEKADDYLGGTFFGEDKPRQDYKEFKQFCMDRQASFDQDVDQITDQLISDRDLDNAISASKRLGKLVKNRMVEVATKDASIDAIVFGEESAEHIENFRRLDAQAQPELAQMHLQKAISTARGGSCPTSLESILDGLGIENEADKTEREKLSWHGGKTKKGTCTNCEKKTIVGVANWCKSCIRC